MKLKHMSKLSMGLCGKLAKRVLWSTFAPLNSDFQVSSGQLAPEGLVARMAENGWYFM